MSNFFLFFTPRINFVTDRLLEDEESAVFAIIHESKEKLAFIIEIRKKGKNRPNLVYRMSAILAPGFLSNKNLIKSY